MRKAIEAEFESGCQACPRRVEPGQLIVFDVDAGAWIHAEDDPPELEDEPTGVCSSCRLELPRSGVCGECE